MSYLITLFWQLDTLKYTVDRTAKDLDSARQKHSLLKKEVTLLIKRLKFSFAQGPGPM